MVVIIFKLKLKFIKDSSHNKTMLTFSYEQTLPFFYEPAHANAVYI